MTSSTAPKDDARTANPRGIPYAPFAPSVTDYFSSPSEVATTLKSFQEMISKYQFMQTSLARRTLSLREKIPDIQKTLETVQFLRLRKQQHGSNDDDEEASIPPLETTFELNDTLYAKAVVPPTDEVYLWLGANIMLAYPLDEAESLLREKLEKARKGLKEVGEDEGFVREQITTLEVQTARVYNWDVQQKRKEKAEAEGGEGRGKAVAAQG